MNTASPPPRLPRYPLLPVHSREHHRPCLLSFLQTLRLSFSKPSRPHHPFYQSCTGGWVNFFSNFLLLFPVDLTFHAPGQVTHKPLPLSHQAAKIFFSFVEVTLAGDPGEERQAGRRDLEQPLARQGFSSLPHTSLLCRVHCPTTPLLCQEERSWGGCPHSAGIGGLCPLKFTAVSLVLRFSGCD